MLVHFVLLSIICRHLFISLIYNIQHRRCLLIGDCMVFSDRLLEGMIPPSLLSNRSSNWMKSVLDQYKHYSRNLASRDRSILVRRRLVYVLTLAFLFSHQLSTSTVEHPECKTFLMIVVCDHRTSTVAHYLYCFLLQVLQMHFLTVCWNLIAYGSAFFTGYVRKVVTLLIFIKVVVIHYSL